MARVLKRDAARRDLVAQWVWYAESASIEVADRFLFAAEKTLAFLSTQPEIGTPLSVGKAELQRIRRFPISDGFDKDSAFLLSIGGWSRLDSRCARKPGPRMAFGR